MGDMKSDSNTRKQIKDVSPNLPFSSYSTQNLTQRDYVFLSASPHVGVGNHLAPPNHQGIQLQPTDDKLFCVVLWMKTTLQQQDFLITVLQEITDRSRLHGTW